MLWIEALRIMAIAFCIKKKLVKINCRRVHFTKRTLSLWHCKLKTTLLTTVHHGARGEGASVRNQIQFSLSDFSPQQLLPG